MMCHNFLLFIVSNTNVATAENKLEEKSWALSEKLNQNCSSVIAVSMVPANSKIHFNFQLMKRSSITSMIGSNIPGTIYPKIQ